MSDDIVTRLREHQNPWYPLDEAADEIERLRTELEASQMTVKALHKLIGERQ